MADFKIHELGYVAEVKFCFPESLVAVQEDLVFKLVTGIEAWANDNHSLKVTCVDWGTMNPSEWNPNAYPFVAFESKSKEDILTACQYVVDLVRKCGGTVIEQ